MYQYTENNPINFVDPSGMYAIDYVDTFHSIINSESICQFSFTNHSNNFEYTLIEFNNNSIIKSEVPWGSGNIIKGLHSLKNISFVDFKKLKKYLGNPGKNNAWHHIVEQHKDNVAKFGVDKIQNINNIISVPHKYAGSVHRKITGHYNSLIPGTNLKVRDWIKTKPFDEQFEYGIKQLLKYGKIKIKDGKWDFTPFD